MPFFRLDQSRAPLYVVTFEGTATDAEFDKYLATMTLVVERQRKYGMIMDAMRSERPTSRQRKLQSEWLKDQDANLRAYSAGTAFVIGSALVRGGLTAIFWLQPPSVPTTVVSTLAEAESWVTQRMLERDIEPGRPRGA